jgi:hypothetical protein
MSPKTETDHRYENPVPFDDMVRQLLKAKPAPKVAKKKPAKKSSRSHS